MRRWTRKPEQGFFPTAPHVWLVTCQGAKEHKHLSLPTSTRGIVVLLKCIDYRFSLPVVLPGGMRMPIAPDPAGLDLTSSMRLFARLMPGTTHSPQLHCMPCQAYLPTLVLHFGHSSRPSILPCSSSGRIHDSGSRKKCAHEADSLELTVALASRFGACEMRYCDVASPRLAALVLARPKALAYTPTLSTTHVGVVGCWRSVLVDEADLVRVGRLVASAGGVEFPFVEPCLIDGMLLDFVCHVHAVVQLELVFEAVVWIADASPLPEL